MICLSALQQLTVPGYFQRGKTLVIAWWVLRGLGSIMKKFGKDVLSHPFSLPSLSTWDYLSLLPQHSQCIQILDHLNPEKEALLFRVKLSTHALIPSHLAASWGELTVTFEHIYLANTMARPEDKNKCNIYQPQTIGKLSSFFPLYSFWLGNFLSLIIYKKQTELALLNFKTSLR